MMSTYVDNGLLSTFVDAPPSPAALLPGQLAELADRSDEELADDRLVGRAHEVEGGFELKIPADPAEVART